MTTETKPIATEGGHWYTAAGTPMYTITGKNGKERATTLRDARALNLYPSVTTILRTIAKPGLDLWKQKQVLMAALTLTRQSDETDEAFVDRILNDSKEQARQAAETGSAIHGAIEMSIRKQEYGIADTYRPHIDAVWAACLNAGIDLTNGEAERSFAHEYGFGGKVDWHSRAQNIVLDFKTTEWIKATTKPYDEHAMQLAAYSIGLEMRAARRFNVFIGVKDRNVLVCELPEEDHATDRAKFIALTSFWQISNNYQPSKVAA